ACLAAGGSDQGTLAERWDGHTWRIQPTPNPPGGGNILLASVACPASSACTAFGFDETGSGQHLTLAERWNGHTWRIQPTPGVVTFDIGLPAVACPTLSACVAVASYTNNGPNLTLAELWNRPNSGSQSATSHPAIRRGVPLGCARSPLSRAASAWQLSPAQPWHRSRSEEHTSELQSLTNLVCRLLLEKKKKINNNPQQTDKQNAHHHTLSCTS